MSKRILILQPEQESGQILADFFMKRGDQVWQIDQVAQAGKILETGRPDFIFIDLHIPGMEWLDLLSRIHLEYPKTKVIATNKYPDVRRELLANEHGVDVFLRAPFSPQWIENALKRLESGDSTSLLKKPGEQLIPKVRVSMRMKITLPYAILALLFALGAAYLVGRYVMESIQERFNNQLVNSAILSSDWMVQEEERILRTLRQLANTQGIPEALAARNTGLLREIVLPIAANYQEEEVAILDLDGTGLLSLVHVEGGGPLDYEATQGDLRLANLEIVQKVLDRKIDDQGDKFAGLFDPQEGEPYFYIAGPVFNLDNQLTGAIVIGKSLSTLVSQNRQDTLAQISLYRMDGSLMASSLFIQENILPLSEQTVGEALSLQDAATRLREFETTSSPENNPTLRDMSIASSAYTELLGPWEARNGEDLGVIGVSLPQSFQFLPSFFNQLQAFLLVAMAFVGVIAIGMFLANQMTEPLSRVVQATARVAQGNLEVKVPSKGNDEVAVLAHAFNFMVSGLQEGFIYRDLLGRTVSPEVREALRNSFASGSLRLEGQNTIATVLITDIRGFTSISEKEEPATILNWLNEYFGELVPVLASYGGVVDKFEGDAMLAFFGILPAPQTPEESAYLACMAALDMLKVIEQLNQRRASRGEPPLLTGIGVNTGILTAGGLGTADRLNYTIIGDTVNTTQRMQGITNEFGESGIVISESTLKSLKDNRARFFFSPLGEHAFKGKQELLWLYRLMPRAEPARAEAAHD
ncbi:MAG: HAMP domain-containing protein [Chloroflexota bacterium]|nr:MAG: HAMP domain-containing protein [Chloroflexota bacterium]